MNAHLTNSRAGESIEHFAIETFLAEGGMADVYLAQDKELQRKVVIKIIKPELAQSNAYLVRFQKEARITAQLSHPNIVSIYSSGQTPEGQPYLVLDYIEGGTLADRISQFNGPMPAMEVLHLMHTVAAALQVAHKAKIIHRDLKPANILLRPDGSPVISDLGIARLIEDPTLFEASGIMGTFAYMAPEQFQGQLIDGRSDIYALGIMLYEMLAGQVPFNDTELNRIMIAHIRNAPSFLGHIRPDLDASTVSLVHKCLAKKPESRYQTAMELAQAIQQAITNESLRLSTTQVDKSSSSLSQPSPLSITPHSIRIGWGLIAVLFLLLGWLGWKRQNLLTIWSTPTPIATSIMDTSLSPTSALSPTSLVVAIPTSTLAPTRTPAQPTVTMTPQPSVTVIPSPTSFLWSDQIVFQSSRSGDYEIFRMNPDGSQQIAITENDADDQYPMVSPSGEWIVFQSNRNEQWDIYLINIVGNGERNLTNNAADDTLPIWSPDGQQIAYLSEETGWRNLYTMTLDGNNKQPITQITGQDVGRASWSVNNEFVFHLGTDRGATWEIWKTTHDGSGLTQLTLNSTSDWSPEWSPDGRYIIYMSAIETGDAAIYLMNQDGSNQHLFYNSSNYEWSPRWLPDGRGILFSVTEGLTDSIYLRETAGMGVRLIASNASYPSWSSGNLSTQNPLLPALPSLSCVLTVGEIVHTGENARLWSQPDVLLGIFINDVPPNSSLRVISGPVGGQIRDDSTVLGWWWEVENISTNQKGWIWDSRLVECTNS